MDQFKNRHIGINEEDKIKMLDKLGLSSIDELINQTIPSDIRLSNPLSLPEPLSEQEYAEEIANIASQNKVFASYIGMGWYDTITPAVVIAMYSKTPCGIHLIPHIRRRFLKVDLRLCLISKLSLVILQLYLWQTALYLMKQLQQQKQQL